MHQGKISVEPFLAVGNVSKNYGNIAALDKVSLDFFPGEVHGLVGENGAGKTTLMRLLAGEEAPSSGHINVAGFGAVSTPSEAMAAGIAIIHQQFQLVESLSVAENLFLGKPQRRLKLGPLSIVDRKKMNEEAAERLRPFGLDSRVSHLVRDLTVGEKQLVEICRSLDDEVRMLILDEPTASLGDAEIEVLFAHVKRIRQLGASVALIAHNIEEVLSISDRISVLRDGRLVGSLMRDQVDSEELVRLIVGRSVDRRFPKSQVKRGAPLLETRGLLQGEKDEITVHRGEMLGLPSYIGSMVDDFLDRISGARPANGEISLEGRAIANSSIAQRIRSGVATVPGNTLAEGLVPNFSIEDNILLPNLRKFSVAGFIDRARLRQAVDTLIEDLDIRPADRSAIVSNLSGGNRQKIILAKWLASGATVFVMNDPTKAVDVGAKIEIYRLMGKVVEQGGAVLFSSSDTDELVGMADSVVVVRGEEAIARFDGHPIDKQALLHAVVGSANAAE